MLWLLRHGTRATTTTTHQQWKKTKGSEERFWWKTVFQMVTDECNAALCRWMNRGHRITGLKQSEPGRGWSEVRPTNAKEMEYWKLNATLQKYKEDEWRKGCVHCPASSWKAIHEINSTLSTEVNQNLFCSSFMTSFLYSLEWAQWKDSLPPIIIFRDHVLMGI